MLAADAEAWEFLLARAELDRVQKERLDSFQTETRRTEYLAEVEAFAQAVQRDQTVKAGRKAELAELKGRLEERSVSPKEKRQILEKILKIAPGNGDVLVRLAFDSTLEEEWAQALEYTRTFLKRAGRQNAGRLRVGLLEGEILHYLGVQEEARASLEAYARRTRDPWYRAVSECLLGQRTEDSLKKEAGESPEKLLTLHTALGFWAEGSGENERAIEHYREALESFMDTWLEFDFAKERIKTLRQPSE